jgi:transposase-like protein
VVDRLEREATSCELVTLVRIARGLRRQPRALLPPAPSVARVRSTEEERARAVAGYLDGRSAPAIAEDLGRSSEAIYTWLRAAGVPVRSPGRRLLDVDVERIVALREGGATLQAIADEMGISRQAVHQRLRSRQRDQMREESQ